MDTKLIEALKELKFFHLLYTFYIFLGTLAPGFLMIYLYQPEMIIKLDAFKLTLFCFSLTIPVFTLNLALAEMFTGSVSHDVKDNENDEKKLKVNFFGSAGLGFLAFYPVLTVAYFAHWPFGIFLLWLAIVEVVFGGFALFLDRVGDWMRKHHKNPTQATR